MNAINRCVTAALFATSAFGGGVQAAEEVDLARIDLSYISSATLVRPARNPLSVSVVEYDLPMDHRFEQAPRAPDGFAPVFPYALLREGVKGHAAVAVIIGADGVVARTCVREATRPEFGEALVAALVATRFEPAVVTGQPTASVLGIWHDFVPSGFGTSVSRDERRALELETKSPGAITKPAALDAPIRVAKRVNPAFPRSNGAPLQPGEATVEFLVDESGHAHLARVASATDPTYGYAAVQAVSEWQFEKPRAAGRPAVVRVKVALKFNLTTDAKPLAQAR